MKTIIKKLNIFAILALGVFVMPIMVSADVYSGWDTGYSDYDFYGSTGYSDYGSYGSTGYSDYDYYGNTGYTDYSYDTTGYSDYDYYGNTGYSDYTYSNTGYSDYDYYGSTGYSNYDYYGSTGYSDYDFYGSTGYSDYNFYDTYTPTYVAPTYVTPTYVTPTTYASDLSWLYNNPSYNYGNDYDYGYYDYNYDYNYDWDYDYDWDYCEGDCGQNPTPRVEVTCSVSDRTVEVDDSVTFTANATGGRGSYTYDWSNDVSGSTRIITEEFDEEGVYYAQVRVTDRDGRTSSVNCAPVFVDEEEDDSDDFEVSCRVSDTSIDEDDTVRFTAEVEGGDAPYEYDWSGDVDSDEEEFTERFTREGRYDVVLTVQDDEGRIARDTCSTIRVGDDDDDDDDDDDFDVNSGVFSSGTTYYPTNPTGNLASVGSVYLNQVPYTGPEDVAKGIAFVVAIVAWSIAGALIIRNKMDKKVISNNIAAFKLANKSNRI